MKTLIVRKFVAIFTAISLAFLQAVPAGFAANASVDQAQAQSVPVQAEVPADNTKSTTTAQTPIPSGSLSDPSPLSPASSSSSSSKVPVPTDVTATVPTSTGVITLKGKKVANTSIWYSLDQGATYNQLVASGTGAYWSGNITLPVGSTTVSVIAKKSENVSGVSTLVSSEATNLTVAYAAPVVLVPTLSAGTPTAAGVVTLSGTRAASTSIWYSINGSAYKQLVAAGTATTWSGNITLPVGSSDVKIMAKMATKVSGVSTTLSSEAASLTVAYAAPVVAVPVISLGTPSAAGVVTLSGTRAANTSIWYSLNGGAYKQLVASGSATTWAGNITLTVGSNTVSVIAKTTTKVSGVSTTLSSAAANLTVAYAAPVVATPAAKAGVPTAAGVATLSGTREANTSIWYSLNGGAYKQLVASGSATTWSGNITLPVGITSIDIIAKKTVSISGVSTVISSASVNLGAITYAAPTVAIPTNVTVTAPTSAGVVTLKGAKAASTSIWYSIDGGVNYTQLVASGSATTWSGNITLTAGTTTVLIIAKKTATVSGVSTVISSAPVNLGPITYLSPAVQAYVTALQQQVGDSFKVTATPQSDGTYLVHVGIVAPACHPGEICLPVPTPAGAFSSLEFNLNAMGDLDQDSIQADYDNIAIAVGADPSAGDKKVVGKLLYAGLNQLLTNVPVRHCEGDVCTTQYNTVSVLPVTVLATMTKIMVTSVDVDGAIRFVKNGKNYKCYRDANGNVVVEDSAEVLRAEILANVTAEIARVTAELAAAEAKLATQLAEWEAKVAQLKADLAAGKADADSIRVALEDYLGQVGVSDDLKNDMKFYLARSGDLLQGLSLAEQQYASILKMGVRMTGLAVEGAKEYLAALRAHEVKVVAAKTLEELNPLQILPPRAMIAQLMPPYPVADPRIALSELGAEGKLLKEKLDALPPLTVRKVQHAVEVGLVNTFGFEQAALEQWIKDGKIVISVDLETLTATVAIDPSVTLPAGATNLVDPLGLTTLPQTITYQYAVAQSFQEVCKLGGSCEYPKYYYLQSAHFQSEVLSYDLSYVPEGAATIPEAPFVGDNFVHLTQIYNEEQELVKDVKYLYIGNPGGTIINNGGGSPIAIQSHQQLVSATITYQNPTDGIASREVAYGPSGMVVSLGDAQSQILSVTDKDTAGDVIATSRFVYLTEHVQINCAPGANCVQPPDRIIFAGISRTDASGNPLSEITINGAIAHMTLPDGRAKEVEFASLEQLLDEARKFEQELPPAVDQLLQQLRTQNPWWDIKATLILNSNPPQYQVTVSAPDGSIMPKPTLQVVNPDGTITWHSMGLLQGVSATFPEGGLMGMNFIVAQDGRLVELQSAAYMGRQDIDFKLLLDAMRQMPYLNGRLPALPPPGSEWLMDASCITSMMKAVVTSIDATGVIRFTLGDTNYKAYRDANGQVRLEEDLSAEDQELLEFVNSPNFNFDFNRDGQRDLVDLMLFSRFDGVDQDDLLRFVSNEAKLKLDLNQDDMVDPTDVLRFGEMLQQIETARELASALESATLQASPDAVDLNGDGVVDQADVARLEQLIQYAQLNASPDLWNYDMNWDGVIDSADVQVFQSALANAVKYDLNKDGKTDWNDLYVLEQYLYDSFVSSWDNQVYIGGIVYTIAQTEEGRFVLTNGDTTVQSDANNRIVIAGNTYQITQESYYGYEYIQFQRLSSDVSLDVNGDGVIDWSDDSYMWQFFDTYRDINGDGVVSQDDLARLNAVLQLADLDQNGVVDQPDMDRLQFEMGYGDINKDNKVDETDLALFQEALRSFGGDLNGDGKVDNDDILFATQGYDAALAVLDYLSPDVKAILDLNKDGVVSQADRNFLVERISEQKFKPFKFEVALSPNNQNVKVFKVDVDVNGNATVTWHDSTLTGTYDHNKNSILISVPGKPVTWAVTFSKDANGVNHLQGFEERGDYPDSGLIYTNSYTTAMDTYLSSITSVFQEPGARSWSSTVYTYAKVGPDQMTVKIDSTIHEAEYDFDDGRKLSYRSKTYLQYNEAGNQTAFVYVSRDPLNGGKDIQYSASYILIGDGKRTDVHIYNLSEDLTSLVNSAQDSSVIDRFAQLKTEGYFTGDPDRGGSFRFSIQYLKNEENQFVARFVQTADFQNIFFVVGSPDVLSGETDDIKFVNGQQTSGYYVQCEEYWHPIASGEFVNDGYRLLFSDPMGGRKAVIDFPNVDIVILDGSEYKITIDQDGILHLENTLSPEEQRQIEIAREFASVLEKAVTQTSSAHVDVNGDGAVDQADVAFLQQLIQYAQLNINTAFWSSDMNWDGVIDSMDVQLFQSAIAPAAKYDLNKDGKTDWVDFNMLEQYLYDSVVSAWDNWDNQVYIGGIVYTITRTEEGLFVLTNGDVVFQSDPNGQIVVAGNTYKITQPSYYGYEYLQFQRLSFDASLDINGDGLVDWSDYNEMWIFFDAYRDINQDGVVNQDDLARLNAVLEFGDLDQNGVVNYADMDQLPSEMMRGDVNKDSQVDEKDLALLQAALKPFDGDLNGDGVVSDADILFANQGYEAALAVLDHLSAEVKAILDVNKDGVVSQADHDFLVERISEHITKEFVEQAATKVVFDELAEQTGLTSTELEASIESYDWNQASDHEWTLTLHFRQGAMAMTNKRLVDVEGDQQLPKMLVQYTVELNDKGYEIQKADWAWGTVPGQAKREGYMLYQNGRLASIAWGGAVACDGIVCPSGEARYQMSSWDVYAYDDEHSSVQITRMLPKAPTGYLLSQVPADAVRWTVITSIFSAAGTLLDRTDSRYDVSGKLTSTNEWIYDADEKLLKGTYLGYDGNGNVVKKDITNYEYNAAGRPTGSVMESVDASGNLLYREVWEHTYDVAGSPLQSLYEKYDTYVRDAANRITSLKVESRKYDGNYKILEHTRAIDVFTYDASGSLKGRNLTTEYLDVSDNPTTHSVENWQYNEAGQLVSHTVTWFDLQGNIYATEVKCTPELLAQAKDVLGSSVEKGVRLEYTPALMGGGVTTKFYDVAGKFVGSYWADGSPFATTQPVWRDEQGNVIP